MSFLVTYWWMSLGLGVPFLIHLLSKRPPQDHVFPTTVFLLQVKAEKFSISKIKNFLLLLLRTLMILLFLLALWRPSIETSLLNTEGKRRGNFVLIMDNSFSMSYTEKGQKDLLYQAKEKARLLLSTFHETARKAILSTSKPSKGSLTYSKALALESLKDIKQSQIQRGLERALLRAFDLLKKAGGGEIYIFTDLDTNSWRGITAESVQKMTKNGLQLFFIQLGKESKNNSYFQKVQPQPATIPPNTLVTIDFQLAGSSQKKTVIFKVEGRKKGRTQVSSSGSGKLRWRFARQGVYNCSLTIEEPDVLEGDNTYYFAIQVLPPRKILLVHKMVSRKFSSLFFLEKALDPTGGRGRRQFEIREVQGPRLLDRNLSNYDVIFLVGPGEQRPAQWKALSSFVNQGGAMVIFPPFSQPKKNSMISLNNIRLSPSPLYWVPTDYEKYSLLFPFKEGQNGDLRGPKFYRYAVISPSLLPGWERVLDYNNGAPGLMYRTFQEGMIFAFTSTPDMGEDQKGVVHRDWQWSTLAGEPVFPILIHQIIKKIYGHKSLKPALVGRPFRIFLKKKTQGLRVVGPDLKPRELLLQGSKGEILGTDLPGVYKVKDKRGDLMGVGLNIDPVESKGEKISSQEFSQVAKGGGVFRISKLSELAGKARGASATFDLTGLLLLLLVLLMIVESLLSNIENFGEGWMKKISWNKK